MSFLKSLFGSKKSDSDKSINKQNSNSQIVNYINIIMSLSDPFTQELEIEKLNSSNPGNYDIIIQAGFIFSKNKKYEKARQYYQEFLRRFQTASDQVIGYYQLGVVYRNMKKYNEAIASHSKAIEIDKHAFKSYNGLGDIYFDLKDYKKARDYYLRFYSMEMLKDDLIANRLASIESELGNVKAAIKYQNDAIKINPKQSNYYYNLANFYEKISDSDKLKKTLHLACQKFPDSFLLLSKYVEVRLAYKEEYMLDETKVYAAKAFKLNPTDIMMRHLYANLIINSIEEKMMKNDNFILSNEDIKNLEDAIKIHEDTLTMDFPESLEKLLSDWTIKSCAKASNILGWSDEKWREFVVNAVHLEIAKKIK